MSYTAWDVWTSTEPLPTSEVPLGAAGSDRVNFKRWSGASGWVYPQLLLDCVVWTSTVLADRSIFSRSGHFDSSLRIGEDYDLWLRASRVTPIMRVSRPYALYRMHPNSITKSVPGENYRSLVISRALARWGYSSPDGGSARKSDVDRTLAKSWSDFATAHVYAGNLSHAQAGRPDGVARPFLARQRLEGAPEGGCALLGSREAANNLSVIGARSRL
jgi:hypothetical protein